MARHGAAHAEPAGAAGGGGGAQPGRDPDERPDRAADAGINDAPEQVSKIVELATENGATSIGGNTLFLRGSVRTVFFDWLREHRPDLLPRYEELYRRGAYLPEAQRIEIERAAGAPWAGRGYQERWKHRVLERRRSLEREARERQAEAAAKRRA